MKAKLTTAIADSLKISRMIGNPDSQKPSLGVVIKRFDGSLIRSQERRLAHWAEKSRKQSSWPTAAVVEYGERSLHECLT